MGEKEEVDLPQRWGAVAVAVKKQQQGELPDHWVGRLQERRRPAWGP